MVTAGTPVVIGFRLKGQNMYMTGELNGKTMTAKTDQYTGRSNSTTFWGRELEERRDIRAGATRTYTVTALARSLLGGAPIRFVQLCRHRKRRRQLESHPDAAPTVLAEQFTPRRTRSTCLSIHSCRSFSPNRQQVPANVKITGRKACVQVVMSGILVQRAAAAGDHRRPRGQSNSAVTGVTLRPIRGCGSEQLHRHSHSRNRRSRHAFTTSAHAFSSKFTTYQPLVFDRKDSFAAVGAAAIYDNIYIAAAAIGKSAHGQLFTTATSTSR